MRNLSQYPITNEEIVDTLNKLADDLSSLNLFGDIRPLALRAAAKTIKPSYNLSCNTPEKLAAYYEYCARRTGRTTELVNSLPEGRVIIIVHSLRWGNEIKNLIQEIRPELNIADISFVVWDYNAGEALMKLTQGTGGIPVFFDNAVLDIEMIELVKKTNRVYGPGGVNYNA